MKRILKFLLKIFLYLFALSVLAVLIFKWVPVPFTPLMAIRHFEHPNELLKHDWQPIEKISPNLQLAVISSEDQNFLNHHGFDFKAIEKAIDHNKKGKRVHGASTISQQTAKNIFLWPGRNWVRKGLETYFTFMIEMIWGKKRILEVYLNSVEMGKSVYGAEAAAHYWFQKSAARLTPSEAAALAAILPNPRGYRANPASNYIQQRKNWIVRQMQNYGKFSLSNY
ncbi:MAG: monofunctional biosynthetic peptidoglycan transglycosylase [Gillisia sp.]